MAYTSQLFKGTRTVALLNLLSRCFGFFRDLLSASALGAGTISDCFFVAFKIPNLLRSLFAEGALTSAIIPIFSEESKSETKLQKLFSSCLGFFLIITIITSLTGIFFARDITLLFSPGFNTNGTQVDLATLLLQIMFPYLISICLLSIINGALNINNIFGAAAIGQIIVNIFLIFGAAIAIFYNQATAAIILAFSFLLGGIVQVLYQIKLLKKCNLKFSFHFFPIPTKLKLILKLMLPAILGGMVYQIGIFLNTVLASLLPSGSISWLFYADRISQLPIGIFTVALGSVLLPLLSSAKSEDNNNLYNHNLLRSLGATNFIVVFVSLILFCLAQPIIQLAFQRGAFDSIDTQMTSFAIQASCLCLWAISAQSLLGKAVIAQKNTLVPSLLGILFLILNITSALVFMGKISSQAGFSSKLVFNLQQIIFSFLPSYNYAHLGLAFSAGFSSMLLIPIYCYVISQKQVAISWMPFIKNIIQCAIAAIGSYLIFSSIDNPNSFPLIRIIIGLSIIILSYLFLSYLFKNQESRETFKLLARLARAKFYEKKENKN